MSEVFIQSYLRNVTKEFDTGKSLEHSYRPALKDLVEKMNSSITAINDGKQMKVGAPDFQLYKGKIPIGYIEAKDLHVDLDKEIKTKNQVNRYKASLNNLIFTNYLEFRFYLNGEETERIEIAKLEGKEIRPIEENFERLQVLLKNFTLQQSISIKNAKELATLMANKAKMLLEMKKMMGLNLL